MYFKTTSKYKKQVSAYRFVNKSTENYKTPKNLSLLLKNEVINPWSISRESVQLIKEENPIHVFNGLEHYNLANIPGLLVFSVAFGAILSVLGEEGKLIKEWFNCLFAVMMKMVEISLW